MKTIYNQFLKEYEEFLYKVQNIHNSLVERTNDHRTVIADLNQQRFDSLHDFNLGFDAEGNDLTTLSLDKEYAKGKVLKQSDIIKIFNSKRDSAISKARKMPLFQDKQSDLELIISQNGEKLRAIDLSENTENEAYSKFVKDIEKNVLFSNFLLNRFKNELEKQKLDVKQYDTDVQGIVAVRNDFDHEDINDEDRAKQEAIRLASDMRMVYGPGYGNQITIVKTQVDHMEKMLSTYEEVAQLFEDLVKNDVDSSTDRLLNELNEGITSALSQIEEFKMKEKEATEFRIELNEKEDSYEIIINAPTKGFKCFPYEISKNEFTREALNDYIMQTYLSMAFEDSKKMNGAMFLNGQLYVISPLNEIVDTNEIQDLLKSNEHNLEINNVTVESNMFENDQESELETVQDENVFEKEEDTNNVGTQLDEQEQINIDDVLDNEDEKVRTRTNTSNEINNEIIEEKVQEELPVEETTELLTDDANVEGLDSVVELSDEFNNAADALAETLINNSDMSESLTDELQETLDETLIDGEDKDDLVEDTPDITTDEIIEPLETTESSIIDEEKLNSFVAYDDSISGSLEEQFEKYMGIPFDPEKYEFVSDGAMDDGFDNPYTSYKVERKNEIVVEETPEEVEETVVFTGEIGTGMPAPEEQFEKYMGIPFDPEKYEIQYDGAVDDGYDEPITPFRIVEKNSVVLDQPMIDDENQPELETGEELELNNGFENTSEQPVENENELTDDVDETTKVAEKNDDVKDEEKEEENKSEQSLEGIEDNSNDLTEIPNVNLGVPTSSNNENNEEDKLNSTYYLVTSSRLPKKANKKSLLKTALYGLVGMTSGLIFGSPSKVAAAVGGTAIGAALGAITSVNIKDICRNLINKHYYKKLCKMLKNVNNELKNKDSDYSLTIENILENKDFSLKGKNGERVYEYDIMRPTIYVANENGDKIELDSELVENIDSQTNINIQSEVNKIFERQLKKWYDKDILKTLKKKSGSKDKYALPIDMLHYGFAKTGGIQPTDDLKSYERMTNKVLLDKKGKEESSELENLVNDTETNEDIDIENAVDVTNDADVEDVVDVTNEEDSVEAVDVTSKENFVETLDDISIIKNKIANNDLLSDDEISYYEKYIYENEDSLSPEEIKLYSDYIEGRQHDVEYFEGVLEKISSMEDVTVEDYENLKEYLSVNPDIYKDYKEVIEQYESQFGSSMGTR